MESRFNNAYENFLKNQPNSSINNSFGNIDWSYKENQEEFFQNRNNLDCLNNRRLTLDFWKLWNKKGLFEDKEFLIKYLKSANTCSAILDSQVIPEFVRLGGFELIEKNFNEFEDKIRSGKLAWLCRFSGLMIIWRCDVQRLYKRAKNDPEFGEFF